MKRKKWVWISVKLDHLNIMKRLLKKEKFVFKEKETINGQYVVLEVAHSDNRKVDIYEKVQHIAEQAKQKYTEERVG